MAGDEMLCASRHRPCSPPSPGTGGTTLPGVADVEFVTNEDDTVTTVVVTGGTTALTDQLGDRVVAHYNEAGHVASVDLHMSRAEAMDGLGKVIQMLAETG